LDDRSFLYEFVRDWIQALWRHRAGVAMIAFLCIVVGLGYALLAPETYRAQVRILPPKTGSVQPSFLNQITALTGIGGIGQGGDNSALYPEIAKSRPVLERVLAQPYGEGTFADCFKTDPDHGPVEQSRLRESVSRRINGSIDPMTGIVSLDFIHDDRELTAPFLNAVLDELERFYETEMVNDARERMRSIQARLSEVEEGLTHAEGALQEFLEGNRAAPLPPALELARTRLMREVDVNAALVIELKRQFEIARVEAVGTVSTLDVLERAESPLRRHSPRRALVMVGAAMIAFALSLLYVRYRDVHERYQA